MEDLYGFQFGMTTDSPVIVKIIPQDNRIDIGTDKIRDWVNVKFFEENQMLKDFDGLHFYKDREILIDKICRFDLVTNVLSDSNLLMIKHYWGCEVASY